MKLFLQLILAVTIFYGTVDTVDIASARVQSCLKVSKTVQVDQDWVLGIKSFFYPHQSRLDLYHAVEDLLGKDNAKRASEGSVYYDSCLRWGMDSEGFLISSGFNGKVRKYNTKDLTTSKDMEVDEIRPAQGDGFTAKCYTTLTDNSTFLFQEFCTKEGFMTWCLLTTTPTVPPATLTRVLDHAKARGFKEDQFTEIRYNGCKFAD